MFKRLVMILVSSMLLTTQAMAVDNNGLAEAFNELQYSITVEWDQKDPAFYQQSLERFNQQIQKLQEEGMMTEDMIAFTLANIKDKELARNVEGALNLMRINRASPEVARNYMEELVSKQYSRGASWDGDGGSVIIGLAIIGIMAYAIFYGIRYTCVQRCETNCGLISCTESCRSTCY